MRILDFFRSDEKRATANGPDSAVWGNLSIRTTSSGINISDELALRNSVSFACIRVLSETLASLPLKLFKRVKDGKKIATDHPLYATLHDAPNSYMTSFEFRETMSAHLNLRGNFYGLKRFNGAGELAEIVPLNPVMTTVKMSILGQVVYDYRANGVTETYTADQIWHVKLLSTDGITGLSPVGQAREAIGLSMALEKHGSLLFKNNARPGGVLTMLKSLKEDAVERLTKRWQAAHTGDNTWKVAVLEEGMDYKPIGFSNHDSQFLESRNFQISDIARMFRVPAILIGHSDGAATYSSVEQQFLSFVTHTIRPWVVRIEQSINQHLLPEKDRKKYFAEFQLDGLLRGDMLSRFQAYAIARTNMWMSANEIRAKENMDPIPDGDKFENPNTTAPSGAKEPAGKGASDDKTA